MRGLDRADLEALSDSRNRWEFMPLGRWRSPMRREHQSIRLQCF
jgi:hypothetical protein